MSASLINTDTLYGGCPPASKKVAMHACNLLHTWDTYAECTNKVNWHGKRSRGTFKQLETTLLCLGSQSSNARIWRLPSSLFSSGTSIREGGKWNVSTLCVQSLLCTITQPVTKSSCRRSQVPTQTHCVCATSKSATIVRVGTTWPL